MNPTNINQMLWSNLIATSSANDICSLISTTMSEHKDSDIVDMLNIMEAHVALMNFENVRILKEMRNSVNRKVNCETANINKTVNAAVKQIEDIRFIEEKIGLMKLPVSLREMAEVRLEYPEAPLKELGTYLQPPVGKSGVNHRLRKLGELADKLRDEM